MTIAALSRPWSAAGVTPVPAQEVQTITMAASGGYFSVGTGPWKGYFSETAQLPYSLSTADLQTALVALPAIGTGGVVVTGTPGSSYVLTFAAHRGNVPTLQLGVANLTGGSATIASSVVGKANPIIVVPYIYGAQDVLNVTIVVPATGGCTVYYTTDLDPSEGGAWTAWSGGTKTAGTWNGTIALPVTAIRFVSTTVDSTYSAVL